MNEVSQSDKTEWKEQTMTCVQITELFDEDFRQKHPELKFYKDTIIYENGRWFCPQMIKARKKNKDLRKMWLENLKDSPYLNQSEFSRKVIDSLDSGSD